MLAAVLDSNQSNTLLIQKDLRDFFAKFHINLNFQAYFDQSTYDFDQEDFDQSWLYFALQAFKRLSAKKYQINSFATIGTGSGIDAIGALEILKPKEIILTDINSNALSIAELNLRNYLGIQTIPYQLLQGNICEPLIEENLKIDLIYANLPNIMVSERIDYSTIDSSSLIEEKYLSPEYRKYQQYLLTTAYQFLQTAKHCLSSEGKVLLNIGARVPTELLKVIFEESGYIYEEIYNGFKLQTETELILRGYSRFERDGVEFDFYPFDEAIKIFSKYKNQMLSIQEIKFLLQDIKINSSKALSLFYQGERIGHIVSLILGKQLS